MRYTIIDSGLGGYSFYENLKNNSSFELLIDSEAFPYGNKDLEWLKDRIKLLVDKATTDKVIIACNTLSSIIYYYNLTFSKKVVDVIAPTISFLSMYSYERIVILATKNTIKMDIYTKMLKKSVFYIDATELIYALEKGLDYQIILSEMIVKVKDFDVILLGCTHLIKIKNEFRKRVKKTVLSQDEFF